MAISVRVFRQSCCRRRASTRNLVTMALDSGGRADRQAARAAPEDGHRRLHRQRARSASGSKRNAHPALVFTEDRRLQHRGDRVGTTTWTPRCAALATTMCMFSAQMCTSPQNVYVAKELRGANAAGTVPLDEVAERLAAAIDAVGSEPKKASMILAAIQSPTRRWALLAQRLQAEASKRRPRAAGAARLRPPGVSERTHQHAAADADGQDDTARCTAKNASARSAS